MTSNNKYVVFSMVMALLAVASFGTMEDDVKDCADQLGNLASCIPFVSGTAKKPTPECCDDTRKVKAANSKCLCVLIKESTDPSMGLPVNTTLALQMPSLCNIDAKVSDCPRLLNLPPNSPDAKIFKQADSDSTTSSSTDSPKSTSVSTSSDSTSSSSSLSSSSSSKPNSKPASSSNDGAKSKSYEAKTLLVVMMVSMALMFI